MNAKEKIEKILDKIARLGNEPHLGNSNGNVLAQEALTLLQNCTVIPNDEVPEGLEEALKWATSSDLKGNTIIPDKRFFIIEKVAQAILKHKGGE